MSEFEIALNLAVAALVGLAVGFEREWSGHAEGPAGRFAGVRTFLMLGLLGGVSGLLHSTEAWPLGVAIVAAGAGLTVAAYHAATRRSPHDIEGTTETAALLVLALGVLAGMGWIRIASGAGATAVVLLREKRAIQRFVSKVGEAEVRGAFQFAVLALVVLPLLPEGPYGPFGTIRPRTLWIVVLLISAVNYVGYLARRAVGSARGYVIAGALGGMVSSTAVALAFARTSRSEPGQARALGRGTVAACVVLAPRVFVLTAALNPGFAPRAGLAIAPVLVLGLLALALGGHPAGAEPDQVEAVDSRNPLQLGQALRMALAFQAVLFGIEAARSAFGDVGVLAGAAVAGLTDLDALTLSMSRLAAEPDLAVTAARALAVGIVANSIVKSTVAVVLGTRDYRSVAIPGLLAMALGGVVSLFILGLWG